MLIFLFSCGPQREKDLTGYCGILGPCGGGRGTVNEILISISLDTYICYSPNSLFETVISFLCEKKKEKCASPTLNFCCSFGFSFTLTIGYIVN